MTTTATSSSRFGRAISASRTVGSIIHLAREFGFCYGVDRAVDYAYQARKRFADQRVFLTGEIIHNPHVNQKLRTRRHPLPQRP